tara:strand:- start:3350 stop:3538 length:189 start_codon:yes stop_codon:yes gene_type:complete
MSFDSTFFALSASEMGLNTGIISIIIVSSSLFIFGFIKSSRENEYKKLMDSFVNQNEEEENI